MKKTVLGILSLAILGQSVSTLARSDSESFAGLSVPFAITSAPVLLPVMLTVLGGMASDESSHPVDNKIMMERVANDALINIETGEASEILKIGFQKAKQENIELMNKSDQELSKILIKELISTRGN